MLEKLKYINHKNEVLDMGASGIYVNYNDLHDYSWNYTLLNNKIAKFQKGVVDKTIPLIIMCASESKGIDTKNWLMEVAEKDVLANEPGKLVIGDYYLECYITASKKGDYLINKRYMTAAITITTDTDVWIKETTSVFKKKLAAIMTMDLVETETFLDFPYDYPFDYTSELGNAPLINDHFSDSKFKMTIYGPCTNPIVYIAGHKYAVYTELDDGDYLTVNSITKKCYTTQNDGTIVNCFSLRDRESYLFEKIPAKINEVMWSGEFGFDITLFEERSEPKWT